MLLGGIMGSVRFKNQLNSAPLLAKPLTSGDKFGPDYVGSRGKQPPNPLWRMKTNNVLTDVIAVFGRKYLWWEPVRGQPHSEDRIIAQTMNLGTYDDSLLLEEAVGKARLLEVMLRAEPGWINDRSWEFWRGRLSLVPGSANRYCSPSFETATEPVIGRAFARPVGGLLQR